MSGTDRSKTSPREGDDENSRFSFVRELLEEKDNVTTSNKGNKMNIGEGRGLESSRGVESKIRLNPSATAFTPGVGRSDQMSGTTSFGLHNGGLVPPNNRFLAPAFGNSYQRNTMIDPGGGVIGKDGVGGGRMVGAVPPSGSVAGGASTAGATVGGGGHHANGLQIISLCGLDPQPAIREIPENFTKPKPQPLPHGLPPSASSGGIGLKQPPPTSTATSQATNNSGGAKGPPQIQASSSSTTASPSATAQLPQLLSDTLFEVNDSHTTVFPGCPYLTSELQSVSLHDLTLLLDDEKRTRVSIKINPRDRNPRSIPRALTHGFRELFAYLTFGHLPSFRKIHGYGVDVEHYALWFVHDARDKYVPLPYLVKAARTARTKAIVDQRRKTSLLGATAASSKPARASPAAGGPSPRSEPVGRTGLNEIAIALILIPLLVTLDFVHGTAEHLATGTDDKEEKEEGKEHVVDDDDNDTDPRDKKEGGDEECSSNKQKRPPPPLVAVQREVAAANLMIETPLQLLSTGDNEDAQSGKTIWQRSLDIERKKTNTTGGPSAGEELKTVQHLFLGYYEQERFLKERRKSLASNWHVEWLTSLKVFPDLTASPIKPVSTGTGIELSLPSQQDSNIPSASTLLQDGQFQPVVKFLDQQGLRSVSQRMASYPSYSSAYVAPERVLCEMGYGRQLTEEGSSSSKDSTKKDKKSSVVDESAAKQRGGGSSSSSSSSEPQSHNEKSDIWAIGCLIMFLITGEEPFASDEFPLKYRGIMQLVNQFYFCGLGSAEESIQGLREDRNNFLDSRARAGQPFRMFNVERLRSLLNKIIETRQHLDCDATVLETFLFPLSTTSADTTATTTASILCVEDSCLCDSDLRVSFEKEPKKHSIPETMGGGKRAPIIDRKFDPESYISDTSSLSDSEFVLRTPGGSELDPTAERRFAYTQAAKHKKLLDVLRACLRLKPDDRKSAREILSMGFFSADHLGQNAVNYIKHLQEQSARGMPHSQEFRQEQQQQRSSRGGAGEELPSSTVPPTNTLPSLHLDLMEAVDKELRRKYWSSNSTEKEKGSDRDEGELAKEGEGDEKSSAPRTIAAADLPSDATPSDSPPQDPLEKDVSPEVKAAYKKDVLARIRDDRWIKPFVQSKHLVVESSSSPRSVEEEEDDVGKKEIPTLGHHMYHPLQFAPYLEFLDDVENRCINATADMSRRNASHPSVATAWLVDRLANLDLVVASTQSMERAKQTLSWNLMRKWEKETKVEIEQQLHSAQDSKSSINLSLKKTGEDEEMTEAQTQATSEDEPLLVSSRMEEKRRERTLRIRYFKLNNLENDSVEL